MKISNKFFALMVITVFWGVVFAGVFSGNWQSKEAELEATDINSPADIKGWMKVAEVSEYFKVPIPELLKIWEVASDEDPQQAVKDIAEKHELETEDFREKLTAYLEAQGMVFSEEEVQESQEPASPEKAKDQENSPSPEAAADHEAPGLNSNSNPEDIKGRMTFNEVAKNFNIPTTYLFEKLGLPADQDPQMELRAVVESQGFSINTVKELVRNYPR